MGTIVGLLRLTRPINCLMVGTAVVVSIFLAGMFSASFYPTIFLDIIYGFVTGFMLTAASMAINDYFDREIDAVNEPNRPIPSGEINSKAALVFGVILTTIGLGTSFLVNLSCFFIAVLALILFIIYTIVGKNSGLPGNFLVSACIGIPFLFGSFVISDSIQLNILILTMLAFLSNTGREICKGIVDVKGDRIKDVRTLAVRYGEKNAAIAASIFFFLSVLLSPLPGILYPVSIWFFPFVFITDFGLIMSSIMLLRDSSRESARRVKNLVLLSFMLGLLAFIVGGSD